MSSSKANFLIRNDLAEIIITEYLIATVKMTWIHLHLSEQFAAVDVQTKVVIKMLKVSEIITSSDHIAFRINFLQKPREIVTFKMITNLKPLTQIARINALSFYRTGTSHYCIFDYFKPNVCLLTDFRVVKKYFLFI